MLLGVRGMKNISDINLSAPAVLVHLIKSPICSKRNYLHLDFSFFPWQMLNVSKRGQVDSEFVAGGRENFK